MSSGKLNLLQLGLMSIAAFGFILITACSPEQKEDMVQGFQDGWAGEDAKVVEVFDVPFSTAFQQTPLAYEYNSLEPNIDAKTMETHYTKHAAGYSKNLTEAATEEGVAEGTDTEALLQTISKYSTKMRNNAGGHYNHELFWTLLSNGLNNEPSDAFKAIIEAEFGSWQSFVDDFNGKAKGVFGSGWAWLVVNNDKLAVGSTPNQDNPLMDVSEFRGIPILGLDVWEHAYYLNYQNRRPDYIAAWWKIINWQVVEDRYNAIINNKSEN